VYILRCGDGSLYTGSAKDLERRLGQHRAGKASRYTRSHLPVALVWVQEVESWRGALAAERRIKELSREEKEELLRHGAEAAAAAQPGSSA
jgi:putative endonuclease